MQDDLLGLTAMVARLAKAYLEDTGLELVALVAASWDPGATPSVTSVVIGERSHSLASWKEVEVLGRQVASGPYHLPGGPSKAR